MRVIDGSVADVNRRNGVLVSVGVIKHYGYRPFQICGGDIIVTGNYNDTFALKRGVEGTVFRRGKKIETVGCGGDGRHAYNRCKGKSK